MAQFLGPWPARLLFFVVPYSICFSILLFDRSSFSEQFYYAKPWYRHDKIMSMTSQSTAFVCVTNTNLRFRHERIVLRIWHDEQPLVPSRRNSSSSITAAAARGSRDAGDKRLHRHRRSNNKTYIYMYEHTCQFVCVCMLCMCVYLYVSYSVSHATATLQGKIIGCIIRRLQHKPKEQLVQ